MDGNPFLLSSFIVQRTEAKTGFVFLTIGFLLQMISNADFVNQGSDKNFWLILGTGLVLWLILVFVVGFWGKKSGRTALLNEDGTNFLQSLNEVKKDDPERYIQLACFYGDALDISKRKDEKDFSYAGRLTKILEKHNTN